LGVGITCSVIDQGTLSIPCRLIPGVPQVFKLDFVSLIQVLAPQCVFPACSFSVVSVNSLCVYNPLLQPDCLHFHYCKRIYMFCPYRLTVVVGKTSWNLVGIRSDLRLENASSLSLSILCRHLLTSFLC